MTPEATTKTAIERYLLINDITFRPVDEDLAAGVSDRYIIEFEGQDLFEEPLQFEKKMAFKTEEDRREIRKVMLGNHFVKQAIGLPCCGGNCACKD